MSLDENSNNTPPNKHIIPSPSTRKESCTPITSPWIRLEAEFEIFTVSNVTARPMTKPLSANKDIIRIDEFVNTIVMRNTANPPVE